MITIELNNVSKTFANGKKAVDNISLSMTQGEIFGFLGPNGAGKTTTVKLLTGLLKPDSGNCQVLGIDTSQLPEKVHQISGVVTEHSQMYNHLSGFDNLMFYSQLFGINPKQSKAKALALLEQLNLLEAKDHPLATYSTGMRQRLSLARALIHSPKVLFLDEPTAGLDPESILQVNQMIQQLAQKQQVTIFLCTHQLRYAQEICTNYGLMDRGTLFAQGSLKHLTEQGKQGITVILKANYVPNTIKATKIADLTYVLTLDSEAQIPLIINDIVANQGNVYHVSIQQQSLEDIYFTLLQQDRTKRGITHA